MAAGLCRNFPETPALPPPEGEGRQGAKLDRGALRAGAPREAPGRPWRLAAARERTLTHPLAPFGLCSE